MSIFLGKDCLIDTNANEKERKEEAKESRASNA